MGFNGRQYPHSASRVPMVDSIHTLHHGFRPSTMADHTDVNWMGRRVGVGVAFIACNPKSGKHEDNPKGIWHWPLHISLTNHSLFHMSLRNLRHTKMMRLPVHTTDCVQWHEQSFPVKPQQLYFSSYINPTLNTALLLLLKPHELYTLIST